MVGRGRWSSALLAGVDASTRAATPSATWAVECRQLFREFDYVMRSPQLVHPATQRSSTGATR
jgi:hypothetical protein